MLPSWRDTQYRWANEIRLIHTFVKFGVCSLPYVIGLDSCVVYSKSSIFSAAYLVLFIPSSTEKPTAVTMGVLLQVAVTIAASLSVYARLIGATYSTAVFVFIGCWSVQLALFLAYHSLIHRWFISPTKVLPYPKARSHSCSSRRVQPSR